MREIKFRIWENAPIKDGFAGVMIDMDYAMKSDYLKYALEGKYPLMQFTGLKDTNGVDIYEGDIVKLYDWGGISPLIGIDTITWDNTDACWQTDKRLVEDQYDFANKARFEVIGNIYQNP